MDDESRGVLNIVATVIAFAAAFFCLYLPGLGVALAWIIMIVWYVLFGHHFVTMLIDYVSKTHFSLEDIRADSEKTIEKLLAKNRFEEAIQECRGWMRQDPDNARPHLLFSRIVVDHGNDVPQAIRHFEACVLRRFPADQHAELAAQLASLYRRDGHEDLVAPMFERVRQMHQASPHMDRLV